MKNWHNIDLLEVVEWFAGSEGWIESEEELSKLFDEYLKELKGAIDLADEIAVSEEFNNWSDALCKEGTIHEEQYKSYTYVGKYS